MSLPEPFLQRAINDEVRDEKGSPAQFGRRLQRNFDALDQRFPIQGKNVGDLNLATVHGDRIYSAVSSVANGTAWYTRCASVVVPHSCTISGVRYRVGTLSSGNVAAGLYDADGTLLAESTNSSLAQNSAGTLQGVGFASTYSAGPGVYFTALQFSAATSTFYGATHLIGELDTSASSFGLPSTISTSAGLAVTPMMSTY